MYNACKYSKIASRNMTYSRRVCYAIIGIKMEVMQMIESRCGLLCSACGYREQMGCKGCCTYGQAFLGR